MRERTLAFFAIQAGAQVILETGDDNAPLDGFWSSRQQNISCSMVTEAGWVNAYRYFTEALIWPRGLPLDALKLPPPSRDSVAAMVKACSVQQGLANGDPDVDAIYRLVLPLPFEFREAEPLGLGRGSWCPFNSQNTTFFPEAYPLLYVPYHCSFRMTDIWRSFVALAIMHVNDWGLMFHGETVFQDRNEHSLMRDFADEVSGYLNNRRIAEELSTLKLLAGEAEIASNMRLCYQRLIELELVGSAELDLLDAWFSDLIQVRSAAQG